jgi:putative methylase
MLNKKQLEIILSKLKESNLPKPSLEQYTIPSSLAAEILNLAYLHGDIKNKTVFDLGCGSCRLSIGALLFGAKEIVGVDIDRDMLDVAEENIVNLNSLSSEFKIKGSIKLICDDIKNFSDKCDTVIQNPPFGIQSLHADRIFLEKALECGKRIYSLHKDGYEKTQKFLTNFIENKGGKIEQIIPYKFSIPHMFRFHKKPRFTYNVDLYVIRKL